MISHDAIEVAQDDRRDSISRPTATHLEARVPNHGHHTHDTSGSVVTMTAPTRSPSLISCELPSLVTSPIGSQIVVANESPSYDFELQASTTASIPSSSLFTIASYKRNLSSGQFLSTIAEAASMAYSHDLEISLSGMKRFRKIISASDPPFQEIVDAYVVPRFVQLLELTDYPQFQLDTIVVLAGLSSSTNTEHIRAVVASGAVPLFVRLIQSTDDWAPGREIVQEQALKALGHICSHAANFRDFVWASQVVPALYGLFQDHNNARPRPLHTTVARMGARLLSKLCQGKPSPPVRSIRPLLPLLKSLLAGSQAEPRPDSEQGEYGQQPVTDEETVAHACWAIAHITGGSNELIQAVLDEPGLVQCLVELLKTMPTSSLLVDESGDHQNVNDCDDDCSRDTQLATLKAIGYIAMGDDNQTQLLISLNVLPTLAAMLEVYVTDYSSTHCQANPNRSTLTAYLKETCWVLSNIAAGTQLHIDAVIDTGVIPALAHILLLSPTCDPHVLYEAAWTLVNIVCGGSIEHKKTLLANRGISALTKALICNDIDLLTALLNSLSLLFELALVEREDTLGFVSFADVRKLHINELIDIEKLFRWHSDPSVVNNARRVLASVKWDQRETKCMEVRMMVDF